MAAVGTLDLASVTDALVAALQAAIDASPLWGEVTKIEIKVTGESPDVARKKPEACQLCLSLIHVAPNASYRNRSFPGSGGTVTSPEPMALTLTYVLVAFAGTYVEEQQAMSTALAWIISHPIQHLTVTAAPPHIIDCTLTIETATLDEIARLWQSVTGAMRLTALLRVAVVFLGSEPAPGPPADPPTRMGMLVGPASSLARSPQLLVVAGPVSIAAGDPAAPNVQLAPGEVAVVSGIGLDGTEPLFLSPLDDSASFDVTTWVTDRGPNSLRLTLPAAGTPPAGTPAPGIYRLRIWAPTGASIPLEIGP